MDGRLRDALLLVEPRRRRRVRRLLRRMDRLDRRDARGVRRSVQGARPRRAAAAATGLVVVLAGVSVLSLRDGTSTSSFPDRPDDAEDTALGEPREPRRPSRAFAFVETQSGSDRPVTYDPCVPIHVVVNARTIVDDGMQLLDEAIEQVTRSSGLVFVVDGLTEDVRADEDRATTSDGTAWLPVVVEWTDPQASADLAGRVAGIGGSASIERDGHRWFVTGAVRLDGPQLAELMAEPDGRAVARSVIMHELGHVVGLDHVDDPGQLMQPEGRRTLTAWGRGDRTGLAALGRGDCIDY